MSKNTTNLNEFIIFDLETIGLEPENGRILEIAAIKIKDWKIVDEYVQLIDPEISVPKVITNLTGIKNNDIKGKPKIEECLNDFISFIDNLPIIGHNILDFDKPYIEFNLSKYGFGSFLKNLPLDTLELSIFLLPELRKHKLEYLYKYLVTDKKKQKHRAKDDCLMNFEVLKALRKVRDNEWDRNWLLHIGEIVKKEKWPWADFIMNLGDTLELGQEIVGYLPVENYLEKLNWNKIKKIDEETDKEEDEDEKEETFVNIDTDEVKNVFSGKTVGSLKKVLGADYEYRKQQEEMSLGITSAINNNKDLVVEAPTGCGKSLAYLIPSVYWSIKNNNSPVIISTYTNALQDQLFENDFQLVNNLFDLNLKITVAKGREHYLCIRRLKNYFEEIFIEKDKLFKTNGKFSEKLFSVFLANWVIRNKKNNCDLDRFPFWLQNCSDKFKKGLVNSTTDTCQKRFCPFYEKCFLNKLKIATRESNIIISNHSLVFSDPWDNPDAFSVLPNNFKILVIDEAINIEQATTSASTESFDKNKFEYHVLEFYDRNYPKKGFLNKIRRHLERVGDRTLIERMERIERTAGQLVEDNQVLFGIILNEVAGQTLKYDDRVEIFPEFLESISLPLENVSGQLNEIVIFLDILAKTYCENEKNSFCQEVKNYQARFACYFDFIAILNELNKEKYIFYRVINSTMDNASLNFCYKDVGTYLETNLYYKKLKSIIFTSATLTYENSFNFIDKIWGLDSIPEEKIDYIKLPYLFDYEKQAILFLMNELPNRDRNNAHENEQVFYPQNADFLKKIIVANNGSALMLFTNKQDTLKFSEILVDDLEKNNIPLYSTERSKDLRVMSGNKSSIVEEFKESIESCLIGTAGLREGINVPGNSLEMVLIIKLPFEVPSDPIVKNRQALYGGFNSYILPHCLFSIKQAFGRLIRTKTDSGFVFIIDSRVMNYSNVLRKNLPNNLNIVNFSLENLSRFEKMLKSTKGEKKRIEKILKKIIEGRV